MTIGEDRNEDRPVDRELCLAAQLSFRYNGAVKRTQYRPGCSDSPANLTLHTLTPEQDPEVAYLNSFTWAKDYRCLQCHIKILCY